VLEDPIMTQPSISITDDLLSAYIDGEVSPVERERVERALARSESLRAELRALRRASRADAELPRVALPADFSAGVLQAIEQRALAPTPGAGATSVWSRHGKKLAAVAALAACVALAVNFGGKPPEAPQLVNEFPADPTVAPGAGASGTGLAVPAAQGHPAPIAPEEGVAIAAAPGSLSVPLPRGSKDHKALVGRIVDAYDPAGVAVVKVYVVDYDETWQRLQVVLEKSSFVDTDDQATGVVDAQGDGELVAVLTGAPTERLEQALAALAKDEGVLGLELGAEPLLVAALDEKFRSGFAVASADPANTPVTRTPIRLPGQAAGGADAPITRSVGAGAPLPPPSASSAGNAVADAIRKGMAWSRTVLVPSSAIADLSAASPHAEKAPHGTGSEPTSTEPVQVLFVLERAQ
jgi:anti-sigma factor RsiW